MVPMEPASVGEGTKFDMTVTVKYQKSKDLPRLGPCCDIYTVGGRVGDCEQAQERGARDSAGRGHTTGP